MIAKLGLIVTVLFSVEMVFVQAEEQKQENQKKPKINWKNAYDSDSEFMRGFETGIFLRTKGGKIEEYGC